MLVRQAHVRFGWLLTLLLTLQACTRAAAPVAPPGSTTPAAEKATPGLFLYEVRGPAGSVHLLGTIHVGFGFEEVLTPDARARFERATRVMTEADIAAADPERLIQAALLPPERSLRAILGEPTWTKLVARIGGQIPAAMLDRLKPWLPGVLLGLDELERALLELKPGAEARMMDVELMKLAAERGKQLGHFETVEEQIAVFDSITLEEQVRELSQSLASESHAQARTLLESFAAGDQERLARSLFDAEQLASAPGFYERVLFERNARWLPAIERELTRSGTFIAVGAGHLLGERGLLSELQKRGFIVRRVGG